MQGTLEETFKKDGRWITRRLAADRDYKTPDGGTLVLPGRSLMLVRNVGQHLYTDAVLDGSGSETPEAFWMPRLQRSSRRIACSVGETAMGIDLYRETQNARSRRRWHLPTPCSARSKRRWAS